MLYRLNNTRHEWRATFSPQNKAGHVNKGPWRLRCLANCSDSNGIVRFPPPQHPPPPTTTLIHKHNATQHITWQALVCTKRDTNRNSPSFVIRATCFTGRMPTKLKRTYRLQIPNKKGFVGSIGDWRQQQLHLPNHQQRMQNLRLKRRASSVTVVAIVALILHHPPPGPLELFSHQSGIIVLVR